MRLRTLAVLATFLLGTGPVLARVSVPGWVTQQAAVKPLAESVDAPASLLYGHIDVSRDGSLIVLRQRLVYRILTTEGLSWGQLLVLYDANSSVKHVQGWRLSSDGAPLEELERDHIKRVAANLHFADDSRQLVATFRNVEKGDIVAFEYEARRSSFFDDLYLPLGQSIEVVHEEVSVPDGVRAAVLNDPQGRVKRQGNTYLLEHQPVYRSEPHMPPAADRSPTLALSFSPAGSSWSSFARRYWNLTSKALTMDPSSLARADKLVPFTTAQQYIRDVIHFAAADVSYVDIELGDGGYIPRGCGFVLDRRYGDCKDKVFLAAALLRAHGITAYPVLAKPREFGRVVPEFVGNQFNHAVLAVQLDIGTGALANTEIDGHPYLLADVTDRITQPPFLPASLEGTRGLLAREDGGQLITLPSSSAADNVTRYEIEAALRSDGSAAAEITEVKAGLPAFSELSFREDLTQSDEAEKYRSWIQRVIPGAVLSAHTFSRQQADVRTSYSVTMPRYTLRTTDGLYVLPDPMAANKKNPFRRHTRRWGLRFSYRSTMLARIHWTWPAEAKLVSVPDNASMSTPYFECHRQSKREGRGVSFEYRVIWKVTNVPAGDYVAFRKAYRGYLRLLTATFVIGSSAQPPLPGR
ncbi:MAG: DUF3857 and transglutaminase domain-containing protein [Acidobacteria bacterium]|nr:DUF3857 and transglutaminase domain-containing protein [Acidobacteriota bacterium]